MDIGEILKYNTVIQTEMTEERSATSEEQTRLEQASRGIINNTKATYFLSNASIHVMMQLCDASLVSK